MQSPGITGEEGCYEGETEGHWGREGCGGRRGTMFSDLGYCDGTRDTLKKSIAISSSGYLLHRGLGSSDVCSGRGARFLLSSHTNSDDHGLASYITRPPYIRWKSTSCWICDLATGVSGTKLLVGRRRGYEWTRYLSSSHRRYSTWDGKEEQFA